MNTTGISLVTLISHDAMSNVFLFADTRSVLNIMVANKCFHKFVASMIGKIYENVVSINNGAYSIFNTHVTANVIVDCYVKKKIDHDKVIAIISKQYSNQYLNDSKIIYRFITIGGDTPNKNDISIRSFIKAAKHNDTKINVDYHALEEAYLFKEYPKHSELISGSKYPCYLAKQDIILIKNLIFAHSDTKIYTPTSSLLKVIRKPIEHGYVLLVEKLLEELFATAIDKEVELKIPKTVKKRNDKIARAKISLKKEILSKLNYLSIMSSVGIIFKYGNIDTLKLLCKYLLIKPSEIVSSMLLSLKYSNDNIEIEKYMIQLINEDLIDPASNDCYLVKWAIKNNHRALISKMLPCYNVIKKTNLIDTEPDSDISRYILKELTENPDIHFDIDDYKRAVLTEPIDIAELIWKRLGLTNQLGGGYNLNILRVINGKKIDNMDAELITFINNKKNIDFLLSHPMPYTNTDINIEKITKQYYLLNNRKIDILVCIAVLPYIGCFESPNLKKILIETAIKNISDSDNTQNKELKELLLKTFSNVIKYKDGKSVIQLLKSEQFMTILNNNAAQNNKRIIVAKKIIDISDINISKFIHLTLKYPLFDFSASNNYVLKKLINHNEYELAYMLLQNADVISSIKKKPDFIFDWYIILKKITLEITNQAVDDNIKYILSLLTSKDNDIMKTLVSSRTCDVLECPELFDSMINACINNYHDDDAKLKILEHYISAKNFQSLKIILEKLNISQQLLIRVFDKITKKKMFNLFFEHLTEESKVAIYNSSTILFSLSRKCSSNKDISDVLYTIIEKGDHPYFILHTALTNKLPKKISDLIISKLPDSAKLDLFFKGYPITIDKESLRKLVPKVFGDDNNLNE